MGGAMRISPLATSIITAIIATLVISIVLTGHLRSWAAMVALIGIGLTLAWI
jgi:hypothetical protein